MKAWNWPLVLYLTSGLFNVIFREHSGAPFKLVRAIGFDPIAILEAVRALFEKEVPITIDVPEDEEPTPARVSQVPTRKVSVFVKKDGPGSN